jgi:hypothetical protein
MAGRGETTGRYCLPVHEAPPLSTHAAFRAAGAVFLAADLATLAAHHGLIPASAAMRMALDGALVAAAAGLLAVAMRIRRRQRGTAGKRIDGNAA